MIQLESSQIGVFQWCQVRWMAVIDPYTTHTYYPDESQWTHWQHWNDASIAVNHPHMAFENSWWILIIQPNGFFWQKTLWFCEKWVVCFQTKWWVCGNYGIFHLQKWLMLWNLWNISPPKMVDVSQKWWCCGKWRGMCALLGSTQPWSVWCRPTTSLNLRTAGSLHKSSHKVVPSL